uniref:Uncharacterized protein n=1 Tax=Candidatus Methanophaga sp. ANME-1 ERB7 TaxID=2759913 RepID=A0A7G9Z6N9_9EURY|nr:hypothetical protein JGNPCJAK_00027 [Methanosarcinales archaeon ANME-1 ERB7]
MPPTRTISEKAFTREKKTLEKKIKREKEQVEKRKRKEDRRGRPKNGEDLERFYQIKAGFEEDEGAIKNIIKILKCGIYNI